MLINMIDLDPSISITIITTFSALVLGVLTIIKEIKLKKYELELTQLKNEPKEVKSIITNGTMDLIIDLKFLNAIREKVEDIFKNTSAERFLILFAINGKTDFNFVTVIYEQHKLNMGDDSSFGAINKYINIEIDEDYRRYLKESEIIGPVYLTVSTMNDNLLKSFYTIENISHSIIKFIKRLKKDDNNDVLIYCSIAKKDNKDFTEKERTIIKTNIDVIKGATNELNIH